MGGRLLRAIVGEGGSEEEEEEDAEESRLVDAGLGGGMVR